MRMHIPVDTGTLPGMDVQHVIGGRYQLIDQLGNGGMAVVWRAHDQVLGRTVAVKLLAGRHVGDPVSRELIRAEARAAAALSHPNIAQVHDYGESYDGGAFMPYVVMELVRGPTLEQRMGAGPVTPRFAMRVSAEVAAALAAAHADGLVHRDIKPANIMLTQAGAKVVDFGIAAAIGPGTSREEFEVLGTPAYLAPERLSDDAVEPACDVYSLGLLLYRLLSGQSPWSVDTTTQMLTAHIYIEPAPLPQLPDVPEYITELCNRCLSKDPTLRPSARDAAALLARGSGLRVVDDEELADAPAAGPAVDREPSLLIRREPPRASTSLPRRVPARVGFAVSAESAAPGAPAAPPAGQPATPAEQPATPAEQSATPAEQPAAPAEQSAAPAGRPAAPAAADPPAQAPPPASDPDPDSAKAGPVAAKLPPPPVAAGPHRRRTLLAAGAIVLVAAGALLWLFLPTGEGSSSAADRRIGVPSGTAGAAASAPPSSGTTPSPGSAGTKPPDGRTQGPADPGKGAGTGNAGPAGTGTATGAGPAKTPDDPATTSTTNPPDTTPEVRTLSSTGGSVQATCPSATTAQLLSWTPTKPYKVDSVSEGPATAAVVVFRHGNRRTQMTVTCSAGVPSTANEEI